ncbi:MAG TPA: sigma-54-dependent Fis family transcriptional regulator [Pseudomonadales bacterium]|nr:sigma-54-dependent Fis family transcriptional regulator [Gammaproteobacteria bacterium]HIL82328.1 sigma-54-dependent Fis family transcriptional regulator [Pseudomonadales bacterium]
MLYKKYHIGGTTAESEVGRVTAWEDFMTLGENGSSNVRAVVGNSWKRCLDFELSQKSNRMNEGSGNEYQTQLRARNKDLVLALGELESELRTDLENTENFLLLADPNGVLIEMFGCNKLVDKARSDQIDIGFLWDERSSGTNAVGTAIETGGAVEIHGAEHFKEQIHRWTCSAAPIYDCEGGLLGVVDYTTSNDRYNPQNISSVLSLAQQIEETIRRWDFRRRHQLVEWYQQAKSRWQSDAAFLIDKRGKIILSNKFGSNFSNNDVEFSQIEVVAKSLRNRVNEGSENIAEILQGLDENFQLEVQRASDEWEGGAIIVGARAARSKKVKSIARIGSHDAFVKVISQSDEMADVIDKARRFASTDSSVLITGDTGVGKELIAQAIHEYSPRREGPLVVVNCGTISRELAQSELFGYEPGSFTGASSKGKSGKFEQAHGGTLFLDEIGELPLDVQVMLLRVIQDKLVVRIGGKRERIVDIRVIAATNSCLTDAVDEGRFRSDLFYRLNVLSLHIPALKEREADISILSTYFIDELSKSMNLPQKSLAPQLETVLSDYGWPGNVRQLKFALERMFILCNDTIITLDDLPEEIGSAFVDTQDEHRKQDFSKLQESEREIILKEISALGGNLSLVATHLGIARSTLYRKIDDLGILVRR